MFHPWLFLISSILFFSSTSLSSSQNIQTFFPSPPPSPPVFTSPSLLPPIVDPSSSPPNQFIGGTPSKPGKSTSSSTVVKAVVATAASTLVLAGLVFFLFQRVAMARRRRKETVVAISQPHERETFKRFDGNLKGLIVDEKGLDVLYWRQNLENGRKDSNKTAAAFRKEVFHHKPIGEEQKKSISKRENNKKSNTAIQEVPLLRGKSSSSSLDQIRHELDEPSEDSDFSRPLDSEINVHEVAAVKSSPPPPQPPLPLPPSAFKINSAPPPIPVKKNPAPPPPPMATKKSLAPPPPPPMATKKNPAPPPPPPSSTRPPAPPKSKSSGAAEPSSVEMNAAAQTKMKPLHWDKLTAKADHSMVWDKINEGSFRFDDDLMEALFGSVATNPKSPRKNTTTSNLGSSINNPVSPAQIFILDPRKSQNTAIVLRSLAISRQEILNALLEGQGLNVDTVERLARIAPTKEEESQILEFDGNTTKLADAESFLFHILKAVPSPFARINAMLFRSSYDGEILHVKESLQVLESGCTELRTRGLFVKLLEAVLKAGNRMNAGTARGNAQAFNLSALRKLSDVKSTDGKTTLLHFVVEEVVRSEGKRCLVNRNYSLNRINSRSNENKAAKEEREKEYMMLGLPVVGGLSVDFSNVKKAAMIDYDSFVNMCSILTSRVNETRELFGHGNDQRGLGFVQEMKGFLESAEDELRVVKEEQIRVMELVKRTTEYYQSGASKDKNVQPLQLFVTIKDFLHMVDQACVDIARNQQKKKTTAAVTVKVGPSSSPAARAMASFPNLPRHFMSDKSSSDSDDEF